MADQAQLKGERTSGGHKSAHLNSEDEAVEQEVGAVCAPLRSVSNFTMPKRGAHGQWKPCLKFQCSRDESRCDNFQPTNLDGPEPRCSII
jgi:hypothetical protein